MEEKERRVLRGFVTGVSTPGVNRERPGAPACGREATMPKCPATSQCRGGSGSRGRSEGKE
jgi:hypothetical protein